MKAIICSAGIGSRLGMNIPKALIEINGIKIIEHQLKILKDFDVTVVLGYKYDLVIDVIKKYNCNFIINKNYADTNTSHSIGLTNFNENCLILDGDLLLSESSIKSLSFDYPWIGISDIKSEHPVFVNINNNEVININRQHGNYEWACICYTNPIFFKNCTNEYVFEILNKNLPTNYQKVNIYEIDTISDLNGASKWMSSIKM